MMPIANRQLTRQLVQMKPGRGVTTMSHPGQQPPPQPNSSSLHHSNNDRSRRRQVCLFGLSADPPTGIGGHLGMAQYLASLLLFDEVRILPVYRHMYSTKRKNQTPFHHRVQMCKLVFENDVDNNCISSSSSRCRVVVSEAERICHERHNMNRLDADQKSIINIGTADLLDMLTTDEPNVDFTLALGSDTFIDVASGRWKRTEDVFKLVGHRMVVFRRKKRRSVVGENGGATTSAEETNNDYVAAATSAPADTSLVEENNTYEDDELLQDLIRKWQLINPTTQSSSIHVVCIPTSLTNVSSSAVRQCTNLQELKELVSQSVIDYIVEHKLYAFSEHQEEKEGR